MLVTRIERQKRHPDRVSVFLDGKFAFGLQADIAFTMGLRKGTELDRKTLDLLQHEEEFVLARRSALRLLGYKLRTEKELRGRLREKEFPPGTIDRVIGELGRSGLLDDEKYARAFINDMRRRKPSGRTLLRLELRRRGVSPSRADQQLRQELGADREEADAFAAARKYLRRSARSRRPVEEEKRRQRLARFLLRRGFGWPTISRILKKYGQSEPAAEFGD